MSSLTIDQIEVFACKTDAPQITWAKDMTPMYEANVIVRIITQNGLEGVGGVLVPTEHSYDHSLAEAMKNLFPEVLSKSINDREKLTKHMLTRCVGLNPNAVSPIDIAMWDCYAKSENLPLYKVLGAKRNSMKSYASTPLFEKISEYLDFVNDLSDINVGLFKVTNLNDLQNRFDELKNDNNILSMELSVIDPMLTHQ